MTAIAKFEKRHADCEFAGPCSEASIDHTETVLGVTFPLQYRDFLKQYGAGFFSGVEVYGLPDPEKNNPPIWQDVAKVTKQLRGWKQAGTENPNYIAIAEDGTGVYFFLDTGIAPATKIVAVGPDVERVVSFDLFDFLIDFSEGGITL